MNWKNALIIALAVVLAGTVGYALDFYSGPYRRLYRENQPLMEEFVTRQTWESKTEEEVVELRRTLEKQRRETNVARDELTKKDHLVKDLRTRIEGLRGMIFKVQGEKETLMAEASQLRKALEKSQSRLTELSQQIEELKGDYQRKVQGLQDQMLERDRQIQYYRTNGIDFASQLRDWKVIENPSASTSPNSRANWSGRRVASKGCREIWRTGRKS